MHQFAKGYSASVLKYTGYGTEFWDEERMFLLALERDRRVGERGFTNKTIVVDKGNRVFYAANIVNKNFSSNAHVLTRKFTRTAVWYLLDLPNSDVAMETFHELSSGGIQSYWRAREIEMVTKEKAELMASFIHDFQKTQGGKVQADVDHLGAVFKGESLLLESFGLFLIGCCLAVTAFVLQGVRQVDHGILKALHN